VLRVALAGAAAVAVVFGVLSALPGDKPSLVERAAAAFAVDDDAILHFEIVGRQTNPDGTVVTWSSESWQERSAPFARRTIETRPEGLTCASECPPGPIDTGSPVVISVESAGVGDSTEIYDAEADTIYVDEEPPASAQSRPKLSPGPRPGTSVVTVSAWRIGPDQEPQLVKERIVMRTEKAKRLIERQEAAGIRARAAGRRAVPPADPAPPRLRRRRGRAGTRRRPRGAADRLAGRAHDLPRRRPDLRPDRAPDEWQRRRGHAHVPGIRGAPAHRSQRGAAEPGRPASHRRRQPRSGGVQSRGGSALPERLGTRIDR
jgi:hypothetical protein